MTRIVNVYIVKVFLPSSDVEYRLNSTSKDCESEMFLSQVVLSPAHRYLSPQLAEANNILANGTMVAQFDGGLRNGGFSGPRAD